MRKPNQMLDTHSDIGLAGPASPFAAAYERLVAEFEQALWYDEAGRVSEAYQEYTDACAQALADPLVSERVNRALRQLTDALAESLEGHDARSMVEDAASRYLREVGDAWPQLAPSEQDVESLIAVATGMTTLAWLFGLGATGLVSPFGSTDLFAPATTNGSWDQSAASTDGGQAAPDLAANGPSSVAGESEPAGGATAFSGDDAADDDGIVWQEFAVGDDGQIVQRTAAPESGSDRGRRPDGDAPGPPGGEARQAPRSASAGPAQQVERAYAAYVDALRASGAPVTSPAVAGAPPGGRAPAGAGDFEQRSAELAGAYFRLATGTGSLPELYGTYARLLAGATELIEQQLALARSYERLITAALQRRPSPHLRHAVDAQYRRFLATVQDAWSHIDPAELTPEQLSAMAATTANAAALHDAALGAVDQPPFR